MTGLALCAEPNPDTVTILVAGANLIYAAGLKSIFASHSDVDFAGAAVSFEAMLDLALKTQPSIVILDEYLIEREAERLRWILQVLPRIRLIISVTEKDDEFDMALVRAGARSVITGDVSPIQLFGCIHKVMKTGYAWSSDITSKITEAYQKAGAPSTDGHIELPELSSKESIVVSMVMDCRSNAQIAKRLDTTEQTIKNMLSRLYVRIGVKNRNVLRKALNDIGYPSIY
jgi:DNA-binding NarL/FixJ family response regulator